MRDSDLGVVLNRFTADTSTHLSPQPWLTRIPPGLGMREAHAAACAERRARHAAARAPGYAPATDRPSGRNRRRTPPARRRGTAQALSRGRPRSKRTRTTRRRPPALPRAPRTGRRGARTPKCCSRRRTARARTRPRPTRRRCRLPKCGTPAGAHRTSRFACPRHNTAGARLFARRPPRRARPSGKRCRPTRRASTRRRSRARGWSARDQRGRRAGAESRLRGPPVRSRRAARARPSRTVAFCRTPCRSGRGGSRGRKCRRSTSRPHAPSRRARKTRSRPTGRRSSACRAAGGRSRPTPSPRSQTLAKARGPSDGAHGCQPHSSWACAGPARRARCRQREAPA
mmetsp:Transcript_28464/g.84213  ORF Transcript_28464/g.84213 Transcript_28464/m.84213 type:complete len:343 (-) Transcript_28464:765-1793(-)